MKLINVSKTDKNEIEVILQVQQTQFKSFDGKDDIGELIQNNIITFPDKDTAMNYFNQVKDHNQKVIDDNTTRLEQGAGTLEKINEFAEAINKSNALSKRNSEKIEGLIKMWEATRSLKGNIEKAKKQIEFEDQVIEKLEKL